MNPAATGDDAAAEPVRPVLPEATVVPVLNVANILTLSRLALVPVFLLALFAYDGHDPTWRLIATAVFGVASITDHIDGKLARKLGLITDFGKIADPIADKALTGAALIGLSVLGDLPWWVTLVIAAREVGVTLLRFWVIRHGVIPASPGGKLKTLTQIFAITLFLLPLPEAWLPVAWTAMALAVALTVVTGVDYVVRAVRLRARGKRAMGT
ncbi:CDP-diacylglycerol--glycerol-3-phosphate 3-phosphatidyltransferase [Alloactinosynnema sp. L-07]|uniref:CDP-diacylglycerol--glycerol-3-phosphate 3-phosphatidyltransferase n=1 Tax=Alloactinosynnema sp. L-07 TaxID=1653480 RepID=UPI00065EFA82|nr:CDP-diacylglycerol--glycerol-3-phosphate 3-phosphatidyltransferase [Alloactinosynnema sp. L-07]CRK58467.1 CDP-diacylglycerol--glycerol-3-phosphate 3-phosphatidyltransferase [Alloactinosynnema sp. L-07]